MTDNQKFTDGLSKRADRAYSKYQEARIAALAEYITKIAIAGEATFPALANYEIDWLRDEGFYVTDVTFGDDGEKRTFVGWMT